MTLFKNCSWKFDPWINIALVNGSTLHYTDMKKFLQNLLLRNRWSEFKIISKDCSLCDPFKKLFAKFWSVEKHCRSWGGFLHCGHSKKCFKILLLWNHMSDFEIIHRNVPWVTLFKKMFAKFWSVNKQGISEWELHALYKHIEIFVNSSLKATKNGYGHLKNSGKRSRATLALLFFFFFFSFGRPF